MLSRSRSSPCITAGMIFHVVPLDDWLTAPDLPYTPVSLAQDRFVHCSPDEHVALAVASAFYRDTPGPLMVLLIDEHQLDAVVRWEPPARCRPPASPPTLYSRTSTGASTATRCKE
jgi:uncharacterized protein (DUF952 family)